ncbi:MAG: hypothetical protein RL326_2231 [Pseudomonadota bacterium]|jgi:hypothetical protein
MSITDTGARLLAGIFTRYVTPRNVRTFEVLIIRLAVLFFIAHLALIFLINNVPALSRGESLNYLKAIYTPFSFILAYEVFLLVIILPHSMTEFIGKQFEIITLITLRSFFHDIADVHIHTPLDLSDPAVISLGYDLIASLIMFGLTVTFHRLHSRHREHDSKEPLERFINLKKSMSVCLLIVLAVTSFYNVQSWCSHAITAFVNQTSFPDPNAFFYIDFFNVMVYADVLLLIISFLYDSSFYSVMRNASFIISTVLLRFSLSMSRPTNHVIIVVAFVFSIAVMFVLHFKHKAVSQTAAEPLSVPHK